jgi:hypothetical protein
VQGSGSGLRRYVGGIGGRRGVACAPCRPGAAGAIAAIAAITAITVLFCTARHVVYIIESAASVGYPLVIRWLSIGGAMCCTPPHRWYPLMSVELR